MHKLLSATCLMENKSEMTKITSVTCLHLHRRIVSEVGRENRPIRKETYSQILFCKRASILWLVSIATILSKTFKIQFLFFCAIAHNWCFFVIFKQTFWSILWYHTTLILYFLICLVES